MTPKITLTQQMDYAICSSFDNISLSISKQINQHDPILPKYKPVGTLLI